MTDSKARKKPPIKGRSAGRPTLEDAQRLSETILAVSEKHFLEHGYTDANLDQIAADAYTTKNAIYARFTDRATLFAKVCASVIERHYLQDIATPDDELPLRESLKKRALAIIAAAMQPEAIKFYRVITTNAPTQAEISKSIIPVWTFYVAQFSNYFQSRIDRGLLHIRRPELAAETFARMILSPIHVALVHGMELPSQEEMQQHIDEMTLVFLGGFGRLELEGGPHTEINSSTRA